MVVISGENHEPIFIEGKGHFFTMLSQTREALAAARAPVTKAKVCFVGDREVGKTSLIRRYVQGSFREAYVATLGAKVSSTYALTEQDGKTYGMKLVLWDIMGSSGFRETFKEAYFHGVHAVVAVFDLTRRPSLRQLSTWFASVEDITKPAVRLLMGNKADLADERVVTMEEGREFSEGLKCPYMEVSAKTGKGVAAAFDTLLKKLVKALPELAEER